jgi:hypothetical protein
VALAAGAAAVPAAGPAAALAALQLVMAYYKQTGKAENSGVHLV